MTTGISAPPMGNVMRIPKTKAQPKNKQSNVGIARSACAPLVVAKTT
jgi:hypothetical protein